MIDYEARRWSLHLFNIRGTVLPQIAWRVGLHVLWAAAVVLIHQKVRPIEIAATVHTLIGVALGLLLVFRTNASYERFWEGRKAWGGMVNESRNLARVSRAFFSARAEISRVIALWTAAFAYACMHSLRGERSLGPLAQRLPREEVDAVLASNHVPLAVASRISGIIGSERDAGYISDRIAMSTDWNVQALIDCIGVCERIQKTPLPFAYVVHLRQALALYLFTLPFALVGAFGWSTVVYVLLIAYVLLGIEAIGVEIENPFGTDPNDLPLERICATIESDVLNE